MVIKTTLASFSFTSLITILNAIYFLLPSAVAFICLETRRITLNLRTIKQANNHLLPANHVYFLYQGKV